jgi:hypothetical protein
MAVRARQRGLASTGRGGAPGGESTNATDRRVFRAGERLIASYGEQPWRVHESHLCVLLATANDADLPLAWRLCCLDHCYGPLAVLRSLALCACMERRRRYWAWRIANVSVDPAGPPA